MFFESFALNLWVLAILILALTFDYVTKFFSYWYVRHIPSRTSIPLIGSDYNRVFGLKNTTEEVNALCEKHKNSEFIGSIKSRIPDLIVKDPKALELILTKDAENFNSRGISLDKTQDFCLRHNLFYAEGEKWNLLRHNLESILNSLQRKIKQDEQSANKYLHKLNGEVNANIFVRETLEEIYKYMIFDNNVSGGALSDFVSSIQDRALISRLKFYLKLIFPSLYTKLNINTVQTKIFGDMCKIIRRSDLYNIVKKLCRNHQETLKLKTKDNNAACEILISLIMESFNPCLNVITCAFYKLATNPHIQQKLRLLSNRAERNSFLDSLIKETMRIYPSYAIITRKCTKTYRFPDRDLLLDRGVTITVPVEAIHKDNKHYQNPDEFNPERFSGEMAEKQPHSTFLAYGIGPRRCIGEELSKEMMKNCIDAVTQKFQIDVCSRTPESLVFADHNFSRALISEVYLKFTLSEC